MTPSLLPDPESCYRALSARDRRFDGVFFVGVTSTGIYCRPICPARLPARPNCRFFPTPGMAEAEGFRPCLRCRPERAPGRAPVDASKRLAERAAARIGAGALNGAGVEDLATELHVGPRQLRRALKKEYGATPVQLAQTHRLLLARRLLAETSLPMGRVAAASGFSSLRRFNTLFRERYGMSPGQMRGRGRSRRGETSIPALNLTLDARPPFQWEELVGFLDARTIDGVEAVDGVGRAGGVGRAEGPGGVEVVDGMDRVGSGDGPLPRYLRTLRVEGHRGWVAVERSEGDSPSLNVELSFSLLPVLMATLTRLRHLFDLDAEPEVIGEHLVPDPILGPRVRRCPGLRVPGAGDGFEIGWRAILGQQVSVAAARTLASRFADAFGEEGGEEDRLPPGLRRFPVAPEVVIEAGPDAVGALGIPRTRARCVVELALAVADRAVSLEPGGDVEETLTRLERIRGIGPWTARYIALRALHWPDAFPDGDLGVRKALGGVSAAEVRRLSGPWRPWRAYATLYLWSVDGPTPRTRRENAP